MRIPYNYFRLFRFGIFASICSLGGLAVHFGEEGIVYSANFWLLLGLFVIGFILAHVWKWTENWLVDEIAVIIHRNFFLTLPIPVLIVIAILIGEIF